MKQTFFVTAGAVVLAAAGVMSAAGEGAPQARRYQPTWESLDGVPVAPWFDDAKFGIFIHWGPYSVIGHVKGGRGYAEWVPTQMYADPDYYYPYLEKQFGGHPPEFGYKDIVKLFKAENWDPDGWAALFEKAGAKYVVLTGEHHDGFAMWDSQLTDWCAAKVGPKRDLVGDLARACRARDLKFAPSYHRERHTGFFAKELYAIASAPRPDIAAEIRRDPSAAGLYGPFSYSDEFIADYVARWKELQRKYRPDFMWIDDVPIFYKNKDKDHPQARKFHSAFKPMIADYLNAAREWDKDVYLNNKGRNLNWPVDCGCREMDNLRLPSIGPKWQNPATLGTSYGYMESEEKNDAYKSPTQLIHLLCDTVSKNGNLLLNIGPRADGTIPEGMQRRLLAIGAWLETNGEAIYGTGPWKVFGQEDGDLRFTVKDRMLYVIALEKPSKPFAIESTAGWKADFVESVAVLGTDATIKWRMTEQGIHLEPPAGLAGEHAWVFAVRCKASLIEN